VIENSAIETTAEQPATAASRALAEFKSRINGDEALDVALREALVNDLSSNDPVELSQFILALRARGMG
jgi:hypothetical protein